MLQLQTLFKITYDQMQRHLAGIGVIRSDEFKPFSLI